MARQSLSLCVVTFLQWGQHQGRGWYLPIRSQGASDSVTLRVGVRRCHMGSRGRKMTIMVKIGTDLWRGSLHSSLCQYHPPRGTALRIDVSWEDTLTCPCSVLPLHHLPDPLEPLHDSVTVIVPVFLKVCSEEHQNPRESGYPGVAPQTFWGWSLGSIPYLWATSLVTRMWSLGHALRNTAVNPVLPGRKAVAVSLHYQHLSWCIFLIKWWI